VKLDTLDEYSFEAETERIGLRGVIGRAMTFIGFIALANVFLIALLFHQLLSFQNQIVFAAVGSVVGLVGMVLRGNTLSQLRTAAIASTAAVAATLIVYVLEERFGLWALIALALVFGWLVQKFEHFVWKKL
jgi:hypothetical protein